MVAKILARLESPSRIDAANLEAGFAERLDGHAAAGATSNHDDVINSFWYVGSPFGWRQMLVLRVIGMGASRRMRIELQSGIVDFLVSDFRRVKAHGRKLFDCTEEFASILLAVAILRFIG